MSNSQTDPVAHGVAVFGEMHPPARTAAFAAATDSAVSGDRMQRLAAEFVLGRLWDDTKRLDRRSRSLVTLGALIAFRTGDEFGNNVRVGSANGLTHEGNHALCRVRRLPRRPPGDGGRNAHIQKGRRQGQAHSGRATLLTAKQRKITMARTWLITGCSRGLGHALAKAVIADGNNLVATARDPTDLADLVELAADRVVAAALDVTDDAAAKKAVATAVKRFGGLDVVVNNAGYGNVAPVEDTSLDDFRAQIETNLFGTIIVTKAAIPHFRKQRSGRFIQISSIGGRAGATGRAPYSAAKFGVEGFSEVLATEMAPFGVQVTIIEPGGFRTDFAGASTSISGGNPAYAETVGKTAAMQRDYDGKQPGDPARAARAIIDVSLADDPPLRLVLGSDAYRRAEQSDEARLAELRAWKESSISTDFPKKPG